MDLSLSTRAEGGRHRRRGGRRDRCLHGAEAANNSPIWSTPVASDIVVDMRGVEFLDSTGLGVLVGGLKRIRQNDGSMQLVCTQERIEIFRITGLTKVFPIHESVATAVAAGD